LKISMLSYSDGVGGAARATYRIHQALLRHGLDSQMYVNVARTGDRTVKGPSGKLGKAWPYFRMAHGDLAAMLLKTANTVMHSPAILPSSWPSRLNQSDADVVHMHWINHEMLSLGGIGKIKKPIVWTLHDMWAFCGAEHYTQDIRWREGYLRNNRPDYESGFDLNRWTWRRKQKHWKHPFHITTPSHWLAECVRQSVLMRDWPVNVIPNCIDTTVWEPVEQGLARRLLNLPPDVPLILFGALGGSRDPRKGFDLLSDTLKHLQGQIPGLELVVVGQLAPGKPVELGFPVHYLGRLYDDLTLRIVYSAADLTIIPSRQDNLPNAGLESQACGTPVVAFDTCGLPDIVQHKHTGYLAKAFDTADMAEGVRWIIADADVNMGMRLAARKRAMELWAPDVVAPQYLNLYKNAMAS